MMMRRGGRCREAQAGQVAVMDYQPCSGLGGDSCQGTERSAGVLAAQEMISCCGFRKICLSHLDPA